MITTATRKPQTDLPLEASRARMRSTFSPAEAASSPSPSASVDTQTYHSGWSRLWDAGDFLPWDRMVPSPALSDTLVNHAHLVGTNSLVLPDGTTRRKRALVPGCGRGVDVVLLASFGYDVVGLEYSATAVQEAERYARETEGEELYRAKDGVKDGKGSIKFVQGDFFEEDWLLRAGFDQQSKTGVFDLIYDYTFFCALHPSMRPRWSARMSALLNPNPQANLICLEFPTTKPASSGGPPFSAPPKAYMEHLSHPGEQIPYTTEGEVQVRPFADSGAGALERVGHWHPSDTHAIGKSDEGEVRDYISIWRHR